MSFTRFMLVTASLTCLPTFAAFAQTAPLATPPAAAMAPAGDAGAPVTHGELPARIKEVLLNDPNIIVDAIKKYHDQQEANAEKEIKDSLLKHKADLFNDTDSPSIGDAKTADVTIVEFFDYHCGYCKRLLPSMIQLVKEDPKLRVIFREFPILSEDSVTAAHAAIAASHVAPDKYFDFHQALMKNDGKFDEKTIMDIAKKVGINTAKLKEEMAKPYVSAEIDKNRALAQDLGIRGTPALIIEGPKSAVPEMLPGALPYEEIKKSIAAARNGTAKADTPIVPGAAATPAPASKN